MGNCGKNVGVMEEMRPEVNFTARNPQENVLSKASKVVENESKFEVMGVAGKFHVWKICLKILEKLRDIVLDGLVEIRFFEISKHCHITMGNSGIRIEVMEEMRPEVNFTARNPQEYVFSKVSNMVENELKF